MKGLSFVAYWYRFYYTQVLLDLKIPPYSTDMEIHSVHVPSRNRRAALTLLHDLRGSEE